MSDALSPESVDPARCLFCCEPISPMANVCPHCRGALTPVRSLIASHAALSVRLAAAEAELAELKQAALVLAVPAGVEALADTPQPVPEERRQFGWRAMAENIFLSLTTLVAMHLLLSSLPEMAVLIYRAIALLIAVPFGLRFEHLARPHVTGQILAALGFGVLGMAVVFGTDTLLGLHLMNLRTPLEWTQAGLAVALGHVTGSMAARWWHVRRQRQARHLYLARLSGATFAELLRNPDRIKSQVEVLHTLIEAGTPIATAAAALWMSFGR